MNTLAASTTPLVSIILFCRNSASNIRQALDSILNATFVNIEIVVQDGASTDGTVEILRTYGDRIKLISEPDEGSSDAFRKALLRCTGDYVGCCLSDETLLPDAIAASVDYFLAHPEIGALTGHALITDATGTSQDRIIGEKFDLLDYLFGRQTPYFCASFFSRNALHEVGFFTDNIVYECFEFELWTRFGTQHRVGYLPRALAKYATHDEQLSNTPRAIMRHIEARMTVIDRLFSDAGFYGDNPRLRNRCILGQYKMFYAHAVAYQLGEIITTLEPRIAAASADGGDAVFAQRWIAEQKARRTWLRFGNLFPPELKRWILNRGLHLYVRQSFLAVIRLLQGRTAPAGGAAGGVALENRAELALRHDLATLYSARGQTEEALEQWRLAEPLDDPAIDSFACQAAQRAPTLTASDILALQTRWATRHASHPAIAPQTIAAGNAPGAPIRVGYHCVWWDSATARHQLLNFIRHHDRAKVSPFCYSPIPVPQDIAKHFEAVRVTGQLSDREFAARARADHLDIMIETTGFSPEHRYAAMALRCAPVQISYLNHHATTAVPNLDYVIGDDILSAGPDRAQFTEAIYPLPGCFFCFDLREEINTFASEPPCLGSGYVTFGCFGSASKLSLALIEIWSEILRAVPDSRLFLRSRDLTPPDNQRLIERRFGRFGIGPERLRLMGGTDHATILKNYAEIDISLDTWPYCGGNTIAESFWQGVPVVTLLGDRFSARYGASLVRAHGCPELIGDSTRRYVEIAIALARAPERIAQYRRRLRDATSQSGFNDSAGFAHKMEDAYADMLRHLD